MRNNRETIGLQDGKESLVGFSHGNLTGRDDRGFDLSQLPAKDEAPASDVTDGFDDFLKIGFVEVEDRLGVGREWFERDFARGADVGEWIIAGAATAAYCLTRLRRPATPATAA